jgi:VWFA-related protein
MSRSRAAYFLAVFVLVFGFQVAAFAQQTPAPASPQTTEPPNPTLTERPLPQSAPQQRAITPPGHIHLDITVTDAAGKAVLGLDPSDFKLLDDNQPRKILSFRSFDGINVKPDPPVQVVLVIDMVNLPFQQVAFVRQEIDKFLHENGGHLAQPVSIMLLTDAGLRVQPRPTVDGNALSGLVQQIQGNIRTINSAMGADALLERFRLCVRQMESIAENEATRPGRKLVIWVGPGWPMVVTPELGYYSKRDQLSYFEGIVEFSARLREGRTVLYSVAPANPDAGGTASNNTQFYRGYLKGVQSAKLANPGNLALKVLATQSGGLVLGPDNDLAGQIDRCIADANTFYRISFDPPKADHADEYHDLKVQMSQPGLTVRTNSGYYNQP